jgi:hypothetical protein
LIRCYKSKATAALLFIALGASCNAQQPTETNPPLKAEVRFDFARTGLPVPKYALDVKEDGTGTYAAEDHSSSTPQQVNREFTLTHATTDKIFSLARYVHPKACGTRAKNIADTGSKTLTYVTSTATSSCDYNYSDSKEIESLTDIFQGVAATLDQGRRLDFLHRFDRLGLDDAIAFLASEISAGRSIEVGIIEPTLRSIAADSEVMQRVRAKAAALLAAKPASGTAR